jgi:hypothetical protein
MVDVLTEQLKAAYAVYTEHREEWDALRTPPVFTSSSDCALRESPPPIEEPRRSTHSQSAGEEDHSDSNFGSNSDADTDSEVVDESSSSEFPDSDSAEENERGGDDANSVWEVDAQTGARILQRQREMRSQDEVHLRVSKLLQVCCHIVTECVCECVWRERE